jgi:Flp pilus assembly protein TadG
MKKRVSQEGSALVELALILPFFLVIAFGIIEYGLVMYDQAVITNASREAARSAIAFRNPKFTPDEIKEVAEDYCIRLFSFGGSSTCSKSDVKVCLKPKDDDNCANVPSDKDFVPISNDDEIGVGVEVKYTYKYLVFGKLLGVLTGGDLSEIKLSATTVMNNE